MSENKTPIFSKIFIAMMIFCGLVWVWTVAFILAWPWEKSAQWQPAFRLPAICAQATPCVLQYGKLEEARSSGQLQSLKLGEADGELMEPDAWMRWKTVSGQPWQIEAKSSSWYFQTTVHYRLEEDKPVLVEYQDIGAKALYYGMAGGLFSLLGLYLRRLRR